MSEGAASTEGNGSGEGEGAAEDWRGGNPTLADFPADQAEAFPVLTKSYLETKAMVGKKGVILPKEGDVTDHARFYKEAWGRPETVEGYDLSSFVVPEGLDWDADAQSEVVAAMHAAGASNEMVLSVLNTHAASQVKMFETNQVTIGKGHEAAITVLKEEYGIAYGGAQALGVQAFRAAAGEHADAIQNTILKDGTKLGDHPDFVRVFMKVGEQYAEHGFLGDKGVSTFALTPEAAQKEISEIEANPKLYEQGNPEQKVLQARKDELYKMAFPPKEPR